ncbi:MAG: gluconeogenesis factor YvcK family protein, partial [Acidimicrobiales bacterium]
AALDEAGRLLGTEGRVLPATAVPVTLRAEADGAPVAGQAAVATARRVTRVEVLPANAEPPPAALDAIAAADQVVLGPGSLFTSVLAVVAVPALARAIRTTPAPKIYVCNLRPSPETTGFTVADHVAALAAHGCAPDLVLCDPAAIEVGEVGTNCVLGPLADITGTAHDPVRLAAALADLIG